MSYHSATLRAIIRQRLLSGARARLVVLHIDMVAALKTEE